MKRNLVLLGIAAVLFSITGLALAGEEIRVNVPFAFYANHQLLPAGEYTIQMGALGTGSASSVAIRGKSGTGVAILLTRPVPSQNAKPGQMVFHQYGSKHFLSSISARTCTAGLTPTKVEKELLSQYGANAATILLAETR
jgi:hypothetical protein